MQSQDKALSNPKDLESFEHYIKDVRNRVTLDPTWQDLTLHLRAIRNLVNETIATGSVYTHSSWIAALFPLTSLDLTQCPEFSILAIAEHLGLPHEQCRKMIPKLSSEGREQLASILAADPRHSIALTNLHTLQRFADTCEEQEASFSILFARFLKLSSEGKFRNQDASTRSENCNAALKALNTHLSNCPRNAPTLDMLTRHWQLMARLLKIPSNEAGAPQRWLGLDVFVVLHQLGLGHIVPDVMSPEGTGNRYNAMLRLASIGKAPAAADFNARLEQHPNRLDVEHLSYAIQNPELTLPLAQLERSAIAFDVLRNWLSKLREMELPEPHSADRLKQVFQTLAEHKPRLINDIIASGVRQDKMREIESLREVLLQQDLGL